jgi:hypothetical protein
MASRHPDHSGIITCSTPCPMSTSSPSTTLAERPVKRFDTHANGIRRTERCSAQPPIPGRRPFGGCRFPGREHHPGIGSPTRGPLQDMVAVLDALRQDPEYHAGLTGRRSASTRSEAEAEAEAAAAAFRRVTLRRDTPFSRAPGRSGRYRCRSNIRAGRLIPGLHPSSSNQGAVTMRHRP